MNKINSRGDFLKSGFTLIELLVVVAIIGLLASIVMASLDSARNKGSDAAVKENLLNVRSQAALIFASAGCYGDDPLVGGTNCGSFGLNGVTPCANTANTLFGNSIIWAQITAAANAGTGLANTKCFSNGQDWAVAVQLKTSDGTSPTGPLPDSWCVDNKGTSKSYTWGPSGNYPIANSSCS